MISFGILLCSTIVAAELLNPGEPGVVSSSQSWSSSESMSSDGKNPPVLRRETRSSADETFGVFPNSRTACSACMKKSGDESICMAQSKDSQQFLAHVATVDVIKSPSFALLTCDQKVCQCQPNGDCNKMECDRELQAQAITQLSQAQKRKAKENMDTESGMDFGDGLFAKRHGGLLRDGLSEMGGMGLAHSIAAEMDQATKNMEKDFANVENDIKDNLNKSFRGFGRNFGEGIRNMGYLDGDFGEASKDRPLDDGGKRSRQNQDGTDHDMEDASDAAKSKPQMRMSSHSEVTSSSSSLGPDGKMHTTQKAVEVASDGHHRKKLIDEMEGPFESTEEACSACRKKASLQSQSLLEATRDTKGLCLATKTARGSFNAEHVNMPTLESEAFRGRSSDSCLCTGSNTCAQLSYHVADASATAFNQKAERLNDIHEHAVLAPSNREDVSLLQVKRGIQPTPAENL